MDAEGLLRQWTALAQAPGLYIVDPRRNLVFADEFVAGVMGFDPERTRRGLPTQVFIDAVHPDERERVADQTRNTAEGCKAVTFRVPKPDRADVTARTTCYTFHDEHGPFQNAGTFRVLHNDPTARRHAILELCFAALQLALEQDDDPTQYILWVAIKHLADS